jgi:uncharacterized membrane protein
MSGRILHHLCSHLSEKISRREIVFVLFCIGACIALFLMPTGFEKAVEGDGLHAKGYILNADISGLHTIGIVHIGEQPLTVRIDDGPYEGQIFQTTNHLLGKMEMDKVYRRGESVYTVITLDNGKASGVQVIDRYRIGTLTVLTCMFVLFLVLFAGWVGVKACISFFFSGLCIWKLLLPGYLKGVSPLFLSAGITALIIAATVFLVAGFTRKGMTALTGAIGGVMLTCILAVIFGHFFMIPGEIRPFAETLLYIGYLNLRLSDIYLCGIFIASSGAIMDVTMDIAASMEEVISKKPDIKRTELILSGFRVGRMVIGTMTTTLLLAYSSGYSAMLMMFIAQGVPLMNILNVQYVSGELLNILVGSFGLVAVAPLTAVAGGYIFTYERSSKAVPDTLSERSREFKAMLDLED